ncbi:MAG TPA: hypothetical protein VF339_18210 [Gammaproteobacteria bacterium]
MPRFEPELRDSETYTESNFLRVHTARPAADGDQDGRIVTIEHMRYAATPSGGGWQCSTIVDRERMSKEDALFIAEHYAREHSIPVIYECHD